jgi:hypothetical protein
MAKQPLWSVYRDYYRREVKRSGRVSSVLLATWPRAWATVFVFSMIAEIYPGTSWHRFGHDLPYNLLFATIMATFIRSRLSSKEVSNRVE